MRKLLIITAVAASAIVANIGVASAGVAHATVTHYSASYPCPCFGQFDLSGVHVTNTRFPGVDAGPLSTDTTGGRDNFSGTVTQPPATEVTFTGPGGTSCDPEDQWESDYNGNLFTCAWSETVEPNGSVSGWANYPNGG
jgi:hypothetical protein